MVTPEILKSLGIKNRQEVWADVLNEILPKYDINSPQRIASFIAQCSHESGHFATLLENLNYGAKGLIMTWPRRFSTPELANKYARQPEMIANYVYANRMGNGDESSGDGWKYRGRGLIQLTGKENYEKFANKFDMSLEDAVQYLETPEGATYAACWFWERHNLNALADIGDIKTMTKVINGGYNGLAEREENYRKALTILEA